MQKDFHYYVTYALAKKAGRDAETIAWANQFTDEMKHARLYGIQTQSGLIGNWFDHQIQRTVLIPFHFVPGDNLERLWNVTQNSRLVNNIIDDAKGPIELGIALHSLQDTYSHQNFSGWNEENNECIPWLSNLIPPIGHAQVRTDPDEINKKWEDPRTGRKIDNRKRALKAAQRTFEIFGGKWSKIKIEFEAIFAIRSYDERKKTLIKISGCKRFSQLEGYQKDFEEAAAKQVSIVLA